IDLVNKNVLDRLQLHRDPFRWEERNEKGTIRRHRPQTRPETFADGLGFGDRLPRRWPTCAIADLRTRSAPSVGWCAAVRSEVWQNGRYELMPPSKQKGPARVRVAPNLPDGHDR